jgi:hypothetical protein
VRKAAKHAALCVPKLTPGQADFIKKAIRHRSVRHKELMRLFKISHMTLRDIRDGRTHKDV